MCHGTPVESHWSGAIPCTGSLNPKVGGAGCHPRTYITGVPAPRSPEEAQHGSLGTWPANWANTLDFTELFASKDFKTLCKQLRLQHLFVLLLHAPNGGKYGSGLAGMTCDATNP